MWRSPGTLVFTYMPVEDPAVYENIFRPFLDYLGQCTGKKIVYFPVQSNAAEIEAMRSGHLHVGGFSTGPTGFAVNLAGAVPFTVKGFEKEYQGYRLITIVNQEGQPLPETRRSQGQEGGPHLAIVQLGQPGASGAVPGRGPHAGHGLQGALFRQARPSW